jgi:hypothetical protein
LVAHTLKFVVVFYMASAALVANVRAQTSDQEMILSKYDAAMLFKTSRQDWNLNVEKAVKSGIAKATGGKHSGYVMHTFFPNWILSVGPNYSIPQRPNFIQVTVGYREPIASQMTSNELEKTITKSQKELSPDYVVTGTVERLNGGVAIFFSITDSSSHQ